MNEQVTLTVAIENSYEDGDIVHTQATVTVPSPPLGDDDAMWEWLDEHLYPLTGTGREHGDAWYEVTVTESSEPALAGRKFDFGY